MWPVFAEVGAVKAICNTILNSLGTRWSDYAPLQKEATVSLTTDWTIVLNVSGSGYVAHAMLSAPWEYQIRITIDGVEKWMSRQYGITTEPFVKSYGTEAAAAIRSARSNSLSKLPTGAGSPNEYAQQYPYTGGDAAICVFAMPLFFSTSLLIEVRHASGSGSTSYRYTGGVK